MSIIGPAQPQNALGSTGVLNGIATYTNNLALGATARASSEFPGFPVTSVNDGEYTGLNWGNGGGWNDNTSNRFPDWVEIDLGQQKRISEIDVFTLQDTFGANSIDLTTTFTLYGIQDFQVQYLSESKRGTAGQKNDRPTKPNWVTVPGGGVINNDKVWRQFRFSPLRTSKIRVLVNRALASYSRITEIQVY